MQFETISRQSIDRQVGSYSVKIMARAGSLASRWIPGRLAELLAQHLDSFGKPRWLLTDRRFSSVPLEVVERGALFAGLQRQQAEVEPALMRIRICIRQVGERLFPLLAVALDCSQDRAVDSVLDVK